MAAQGIFLDDLNQKISPQVTKLANDVQGFPESGLDGALVGSSRPSVKLSNSLSRPSTPIRRTWLLSLIPLLRMLEVKGATVRLLE